MALEYPKTRTVDVVDTLFGTPVPDPYRWLENLDDPEVRAWIEAQNHLTRQILDSFPERQKILEELKTLYRTETFSLPNIAQDRYFYFRRKGLQNHAVLYLTEGSFQPGKGKVVLDPNTFSEDGTVALDWLYISPDGHYIAYGKSAQGTELSTLYLLDVTTQSLLPETIPDTRWTSIAWRPHNEGFYYTRNMDPKGFRPYVFYHALGTDPKEDVYVYGKGLPEDHLPGVEASSDHRYLFLSIHRGWGKNDLFVRPMDQDTGWTPIAVGKDATFSADVLRDTLVILTTDQAPRGRIVKAPLSNPQESQWQEIVPQMDGVIEGFQIVGGRIVVHVKQDTYSRLLVYDLQGHLGREIPLPMKGTVAFRGTPDKPVLYYQFQSFFYPPTMFVMNLETGETRQLWQMPIDFDVSQFEQRFVFYSSKDGTRIPMYILMPKAAPMDGSTPTLLTGYGGFGIGISPFFTKHLLPWFRRGGIVAIPGIRGGDEYGETWHKAGMQENKQNVFDDFIAAAEYLIREGYTSPEKLAISGGSNGGLLVGAVMTQRPDLFRAVYCAVPLLDMVRFHKFGVAHIWTTEYGNPDIEEEFRYIYSYSPYHHVQPGVRYPAVFFKTSEGDTRVHPMHAMKMAAKLQAIAPEDRPVLLYVEPKTGHGAGRPLWKFIESYADQLIFLLWQLGMIGD